MAIAADGRSGFAPAVGMRCPRRRAAFTCRGTWRVTYGAPALVRIEATGSDQYVLTAATPVTVTGAACQLPIGTAIATTTGSGTAYTGQHGLWNIADCAFAQYATIEPDSERRQCRASS